MGGRDYTSTERSRRYRRKKSIDPRVQKYYDALPEDERAKLDHQLLTLGKDLADMHWSNSSKALDKRYLYPPVPPKNFDWGRQRKKANEVVVEDLNDIRRGTAGNELSTGKLDEKQDLAGYIKNRLGEGKILADFYLDILASTGRSAQKKGIWMNHRLQAAQWLADRGWGKAKGDEEKAAQVVVQVVDFQNADTPPKPRPIEAQVVEDNPPPEQIVAPVDPVGPVKVEVEDFSLEE